MHISLRIYGLIWSYGKWCYYTLLYFMEGRHWYFCMYIYQLLCMPCWCMIPVVGGRGHNLGKISDYTPPEEIDPRYSHRSSGSIGEGRKYLSLYDFISLCLLVFIHQWTCLHLLLHVAWRRNFLCLSDSLYSLGYLVSHQSFARYYGKSKSFLVLYW